MRFYLFLTKAGPLFSQSGSPWPFDVLKGCTLIKGHTIFGTALYRQEKKLNKSGQHPFICNTLLNMTIPFEPEALYIKFCFLGNHSQTLEMKQDVSLKFHISMVAVSVGCHTNNSNFISHY